MKIKKILELLFNGIAGVFGYKALLKKRKDQNIVMIDKNVWTPYFCPDDSFANYYEGLAKSKVEWSDNFYKQLRHYSLQEVCRYVLRRGLSGDLAECGCWKGHSAYLIAKLFAEEGHVATDFHIFDSFEGGLSEKTRQDENPRRKLDKQELKTESAIFSSTQEEVSLCLSKFKGIKLYPGWIPMRFGEVMEKKFALVHIDVDLYEPTRDSLEFFFPRLVEGGAIVCDDYAMTQFPGSAIAVDEFLNKNQATLFYRVPMGSCVIIK